MSDFLIEKGFCSACWVHCSLLEGSCHSAGTQTPCRGMVLGIKWACISSQTAANVRAWVNYELFQEIYLFSFLTPKLIVRNEIRVCFSLGMLDFFLTSLLEYNCFTIVC